jgi:hypothetical protein
LKKNEILTKFAAPRRKSSLTTSLDNSYGHVGGKPKVLFDLERAPDGSADKALEKIILRGFCHCLRRMLTGRTYLYCFTAYLEALGDGTQSRNLRYHDLRLLDTPRDRLFLY